MASFELSLSESLLLGFYLRKYLESSSSVFEVFERGLRPFVPLLTQTKWVKVDRAEVPDDIKWYVLNRYVEETLVSNELSRSPQALLPRLFPSRSVQGTPEYHFQPAQSTPFDHDGFYIGRAQSCPKTVFVGNDCRDPGRPVGCSYDGMADGKVFRVFWDTSKRSLIELIIDHLRRACHSSDPDLVDRRAIPGSERWLWDFATCLDQTWQAPPPPFDYHPLENDIPWWVVVGGGRHVFGLSDWLDSYVPEGWKPETIQQAMDGIVGSGVHHEVFKIGRQFAELLSTCAGFENNLNKLSGYVGIELHGGPPNSSDDELFEEADKADAAHEKLCETMRSVLGSDCVQRCQHAASILEWELRSRQRLGSPKGFALAEYYESISYGPVPYFRGEHDSYFFSRGSYLGNWFGASGAVWLAFGDMLGTLRETDLATTGKDKPLPLLRSYQLKGDSSVDRVRGALELATRELANEANVGQHPEIIVTCLAHGIEALARRVWASDFSTGGDARQSLVALLDKKRRFGKNELEQRFATLALSLYTAYRNPASHEPDQFRCTWAEAHFFVSGIRVLFDISERLVQHGPAE